MNNWQLIKCSCGIDFVADPNDMTNMELLWNSHFQTRILTPVCPYCKRIH